MNTQKQPAGIKIIYVLGFIVLWGLSIATIKEAHGQTRPCADDVARLCKDVQPGGGGVMNCLKQHENELSPACTERIAAAKERRAELRQACGGDVEQFCKDAQPGRGGIARCLKQHENELSAPCKEKIAQFRNENQK